MTEQEELEYEARPEYDFSNGRRNPYAERARRTAGSLVVIEPELFALFPSSEAVNEALRSYLESRKPDAA